jgi:hypothetical protein
VTALRTTTLSARDRERVKQAAREVAAHNVVTDTETFVL